jgi:HPt (histidine-containing phosphotransfer) domain-containing protein
MDESTTDGASAAAQAASRLEAALERIAGAATSGIIRSGRADPAEPVSPILPELKQRLDSLIAQLRDALGEHPEN